MNQILSTGNSENVVNSGSDINKIVKFFCAIIIIFALAIGGIGGYKLIKNRNKKVYSGPIPEVAVEADGGNATIKVSSRSGVSKLIYTWDDGVDNPIDGENKQELEEPIIVPNGNCTLNIKVIEKSGRETRFVQEFIYDSNEDTKAPEIKIAEENKKVSIVVTDNDELMAIAYRWNNENPVVKKVDDNDKTTIKVTLDAKKGKNKLTVIAKDKSGNTKEASEEIVVASKPKIAVTRSNDTLRIVASDEDEIVKIQYAINDRKESVDITNKYKDKKQIEIKEKLQKGENKIAIVVENKSGLKQTYVGKCSYNP